MDVQGSNQALSGCGAVGCWAWSRDMYTPWRLLAALGLCLRPPASLTDQTVTGLLGLASAVEEGAEKGDAG